MFTVVALARTKSVVEMVALVRYKRLSYNESRLAAQYCLNLRIVQCFR